MHILAKLEPSGARMFRAAAHAMPIAGEAEVDARMASVPSIPDALTLLAQARCGV